MTLMTLARTMIVLLAVAAIARCSFGDDRLWITYEAFDVPARDAHIVLVSGDEEYRSEEALPMLAKILSKRHGFRCTVLFAIDAESGEINPDNRENIPGLEALKSADLMIIATRFRDLPDEQMRHIDEYVKSGKPIIGLRTATHAFNIKSSPTYMHYTWNGKTEGYEQGFGRQVLGETWIAHHGHHGRESTRGVTAPGAESHPIVRGIAPKSIWGPTDVYRVRLPLPGDSTPIVLGQVLVGMDPDDDPVEGAKNEPLMPIGWTRTYEAADGKRGRVFTSTLGAATDFTAEGSRRMLVNAVYWALDRADEIPSTGSDVRLVGSFDPTPFGFGSFKRGVRPSDHVIGETPSSN